MIWLEKDGNEDEDLFTKSFYLYIYFISCLVQLRLSKQEVTKYKKNIRRKSEKGNSNVWI